MDVVANAESVTPSRLDELLLDALKRSLAESAEQRLFRSGKLPGLFPSRTGLAADAALKALTDELLETVRTEVRGKQIVEWVRITPRGVRYVHQRDSAKAVLRELREVLGQTREGVPAWMAEARQSAQTLADRFEQQGRELLARLDGLTERVEAALRRVEAAGLKRRPTWEEQVPWALAALEYLDERLAAGAVSACPIAELFQALRPNWAELSLPVFHQGLLTLQDSGALRLIAHQSALDPEFALFSGHTLCTAVER